MTHRAVVAVVSMILSASVGACGDTAPCPPADLAPLEREPAYAVVTSDFVSTAIAVLDAEGELVTEAWVDSGTTRPGLTTALSGDVTLPSGDVTPGALTWIDRGQDRITRVSTPDGALLDQTSVVLPMEPGETAFFANPQDVLAIDRDTGWVSRLEPNLDPTAPSLDRGNDLVRVDFPSGTLVERIALGALDVTEDVNGQTVRIVARPTGLARVGPRLVVGLQRLSVDFLVTGPGAVGIVDPAGGTASALELEGLSNCGELEPLRDDPARVLVSCSGPPFVDEAGRRESAAVVAVHVGADGTATAESVWRAAEHPNAPVITHGLLSLGGSRVLAVAMGDGPDGTPDRLVELDLATGSTSVVLRGEAPFTLGRGAYDPERALVLWADARAGVRRLSVGAEAVTAIDVVDASPCRGLEAREVASIR